MSDRYFVIEDATGRIVDVTVGRASNLPAGRTSYPVPDGSSAGIGWVRAADGSYSDPFAPAVPPAAPVVILAKVDLFRRCTEEEAVDIMGALSGQSARLQQIFSAALTYRSDAPEWPILVQAAQGLFGEARAAELLAPSA